MRDLLNSRVPGASLFDGSKVRPVALTTTYIGREIPDVSALLASARNCAKLRSGVLNVSVAHKIEAITTGSTRANLQSGLEL
jgi:hypothetical protein